MDRNCKHCGCNDVADDFTFGGGNSCVVCNHCGKRTVIGNGRPEPLVQVSFQSTLCPYCSGKSKITETNKREGGETYRVHECCNRNCGKRFSSIDPGKPAPALPQVAYDIPAGFR